MNEIGELVGFEQENAARVLTAYLNNQNINAQYVNGQPPFPHKIVLSDPKDIHQAHQITKEFLDRPNDPKYQSAAWQNEQPVKLTSQLPRLGRFNLKESLFSAPLTWSILLLCIAVYLLSVMGGFSWVLNNFRIQTLPQLVESGQWWRLVSPAFMHFSELHIIFNLMWWGSLGAQIERKFGSVSLLLILLSTAILSNLAQLVMSGPNFGGLSGVVYGIIGFVWWCGWLRPSWGLSLPNFIIGFSLVWLVLGYLDWLWVSVANTAHTIGLVIGCILAWLFVQIGNKNASRPEQ